MEGTPGPGDTSRLRAGSPAAVAAAYRGAHADGDLSRPHRWLPGTPARPCPATTNTRARRWPRGDTRGLGTRVAWGHGLVPQGTVCDTGTRPSAGHTRLGGGPAPLSPWGCHPQHPQPTPWAPVCNQELPVWGCTSHGWSTGGGSHGGHPIAFNTKAPPRSPLSSCPQRVKASPGWHGGAGGGRAPPHPTGGG